MTLPELDWSRKRVVSEIIPPHPAPEVTARPAMPGEIPVGARRVIKAAVAAGWEVEPTYARGTAMGRHGRAGALIHSLALRMRLPGTRHGAVAVWTSPALSGGRRKWSSDFAATWVAGREPRMIPLTAGRKDPGAPNLAAHLLNPDG